MELWKAIPGYEKSYKVSTRGRVRSLTRWRRTKGDGRCSVPEKILNGTVNGDGYKVVTLFRNGNRRMFGIHQLVLLTFLGPCPEGMEGCHKDGNPANNRLRNVYWGTPSQNWEDRKRHGRGCAGENHPMAKLSDECVERLRRLWRTGRCTQTKLASLFDISQAQVWNLVRYTSRTHKILGLP